MRMAVGLFIAALVAAVPALARDVDPIVRGCSTRAYGDLGRHWRQSAVLAGPLAFVGMRNGYGPRSPARPGRAWPVKVLVVVDPGAVVSVEVGARSESFAALGYDTRPLLRGRNGTVLLSSGSLSVRYEACQRASSGAVWNRGTQFPGYFFVAGPRCVDVEVSTGAATLRRTLRFGVARCGG